MAWNGAGVFNRLYSWTADKAAAINITASRTDADTNDIVTQGLGNCLTRDGQGQPTANLPMANFRHTTVGDGVARTDYTSLGQTQDGKINWVAAAGTGDALTAAYAPAITALVDGQLCYVRAGAANTVTNPTFSPNGLTARVITKVGGTSLVAGDIFAAGHELILRYKLSSTLWELLNPAGLASGLITSADAGAGAGPTLDLFRDSASPAVSDFIGSVEFNGRNSVAAKKLYARLVAQITDPVSTTEDAILLLQAVVAGTLTTMLQTTATGISVPGALTVGAGAAVTGALSATGATTLTGGLAAGTTGVAPLQLVSGTNLTTPTAGAIEYDGTVHCATHAAGERGALQASQWIRQSATYTLTSQTTAQQLFNASTNGAVTVAGSTSYEFECQFDLTAMSASNGNFGFAIGGAATLTSVKFSAVAQKSAGLGNVTNTVAYTQSATASQANITGLTTTTTGCATIKGIICVNAGGTIIPQVLLGVAATAVVGINSFFKLWPIGTNTATTLGNWS